jgi:hypothetical protein
MFPDVPKFRLTLAFSELSLGNFDAASRQLDEALRLFPDHKLGQSIRRRLPELRRLADQPPEDTMHGLLVRSKYAKYAIETARTHDALVLLDRAISKGQLSIGDAEGALFFAAKFANPEATERVFQAYVRAARGNVPESVVEAHRLRKESGQRLLALWPALGIPLPKL